jgi:hypothetical protein
LAYDGYSDAVRTYDLDVFTNGENLYVLKNGDRYELFEKAGETYREYIEEARAKALAKARANGLTAGDGDDKEDLTVENVNAGVVNTNGNEWILESGNGHKGVVPNALLPKRNHRGHKKERKLRSSRRRSSLRKRKQSRRKSRKL